MTAVFWDNIKFPQCSKITDLRIPNILGEEGGQVLRIKTRTCLQLDKCSLPQSYMPSPPLKGEETRWISGKSNCLPSLTTLPTLWKERTGSCKLSSDFYMCIMAYDALS